MARLKSNLERQCQLPVRVPGRVLADLRRAAGSEGKTLSQYVRGLLYVDKRESENRK